MNTQYVYLRSKAPDHLYTVGFYSPNGEWNAESDHDTSEEAAARVRELNGGAAAMPARLWPVPISVDVKISPGRALEPEPAAEGLTYFYVTFAFDKAALQKIAPEEREKELGDTVRCLFAATKKAVVDYLLEQVKETS